MRVKADRFSPASIAMALSFARHKRQPERITEESDVRRWDRTRMGSDVSVTSISKREARGSTVLRLFNLTEDVTEAPLP